MHFSHFLSLPEFPVCWYHYYSAKTTTTTRKHAILTNGSKPKINHFIYIFFIGKWIILSTNTFYQWNRALMLVRQNFHLPPALFLTKRFPLLIVIVVNYEMLHFVSRSCRWKKQQRYGICYLWIHSVFALYCIVEWLFSDKRRRSNKRCLIAIKAAVDATRVNLHCWWNEINFYCLFFAKKHSAKIWK